MKEKDNLSGEESLQIIQQMINTAKQEQKDDGKGWILWGWMLFIVSVLSAVNESIHWVNQYYFWNVFSIVTLLLFVFMLIKYFFFKQKEKVRTYTKDIFEKLNIGFFISLVFIITAINVGINPVKGFALLISLYGFWILIYGTALNFRPSVIAAYITWTIGFLALFIHKFVNSVDDHFQWVMILHALAVFFGYIIPGHIANKEYNKINKKGNKI